MKNINKIFFAFAFLMSISVFSQESTGKTSIKLGLFVTKVFCTEKNDLAETSFNTTGIGANAELFITKKFIIGAEVIAAKNFYSAKGMLGPNFTINDKSSITALGGYVYQGLYKGDNTGDQKLQGGSIKIRYNYTTGNAGLTAGLNYDFTTGKHYLNPAMKVTASAIYPEFGVFWKF